MVKCDSPRSEQDTEQVSGVSFNINDIVGQISNFMGNIREFSNDSEPMGVNVEGFNIAFRKDRNHYEFDIGLKLVFKPKTNIVIPGG